MGFETPHFHFGRLGTRVAARTGCSKPSTAAVTDRAGGKAELSFARLRCATNWFENTSHLPIASEEMPVVLCKFAFHVLYLRSNHFTKVAPHSKKGYQAKQLPQWRIKRSTSRVFEE